LKLRRSARPDRSSGGPSLSHARSGEEFPALVSFAAGAAIAALDLGSVVPEKEHGSLLEARHRLAVTAADRVAALTVKEQAGYYRCQVGGEKMRRSTRAGLAVILTSVFLPLIALMFAESVGESLVIRMGSISQRASFEQFPIGRDPKKEPGVVLIEAADATLLLDKELPKDEANRITREFSRFRGRDPQTTGEVYVFKGWIDEARHALPYRYVVAASLTILLAGLLIILLGSGREPVSEAPRSAMTSKENESGGDR
jgi:hypothetical protein